MKKMRKVQLAVSVLGVTAAVAGLALMSNTVQAKAEEEATFAMKNGAAVRAVENEAGIRWETSVTEAWCTANIPEGATDVTFGTFVTAAGNVSAITELTAETDEVQDLVCKIAADFTDGAFTYYSSIVYNNMSDWEDTEIKAAYATELVARSYVKYTLNEETTYVYADSNENQRSMRAVALAAYEDESENGLTETQKGIVDDYFASEQTAVDFAGYYETANPDTVSGDYTVAYAGAKKVGTVSEGALTLDGLTLGENYTLTLFDDEGNYAKTSEFMYVTQALTQANYKDDLFQTLTAAKAFRDCYYILTEDIDFGDTYYGGSDRLQFYGTLDGNGHTISGINVTGAGGGVFARLNGTVKNIKLVGTLAGGAIQTGLIANVAGVNGAATLENVYAEYDSAGATKPQGALFFRVSHTNKLTMKNVVAYGTNADQNGHTGIMFGQLGNNANKFGFKISMENCYAIAKTVNSAPLSGYNTNGYISSSTSSSNYQYVFTTEDLSETDNVTVTKYTLQKNNTAMGACSGGFTAYQGENAKTDFDNAVGNSLSTELKNLMYPTNN